MTIAMLPNYSDEELLRYVDRHASAEVGELVRRLEARLNVSINIDDMEQEHNDEVVALEKEIEQHEKTIEALNKTVDELSKQLAEVA